MLTNRRLITIVFASALLLALGVGLSLGGTALAMPPAQGVTPTGVTIPYSGRLLDTGGQAMPDSAYDFTFSLYDAAEGGTVLWSETQQGVTVNGGALTTSLGSVTAIPKEVSERKELWLAVSVRGPGEAEFTLLNPRQRFSVAPTAVSALTCPHSHFTDYWNGSTTLSYGLEVDNTGTGDGVRAYSRATASNYAAVFAYNNATTGNGSGVYGGSDRGNGVYAYSGASDAIQATTDTTWASAVYAHATNGNGVWAVSNNRIAVFGATYTNTTQAAHFVNLDHTSSASNSALWVGTYYNTLIEGHDVDQNGNSLNRTFWVARWGDVRADGTFASPAADLAEMLPASQSLEPGDVLVIGPDGKLARSTKPYEAAVVGVYSTKPGFLGGASDRNDAAPDKRLVDAKTGKQDMVPFGADGDIPLAVSGIVPVKVSTENGPILPGDLLVASSTPGYAMRAGANAPQGTVIGKALAALEKGTGTVKMLTMLR